MSEFQHKTISALKFSQNSYFDVCVFTQIAPSLTKKTVTYKEGAVVLQYSSVRYFWVTTDQNQNNNLPLHVKREMRETSNTSTFVSLSFAHKNWSLLCFAVPTETPGFNISEETPSQAAATKLHKVSDLLLFLLSSIRTIKRFTAQMDGNPSGCSMSPRGQLHWSRSAWLKRMTLADRQNSAALLCCRVEAQGLCDGGGGNWTWQI